MQSMEPFLQATKLKFSRKWYLIPMVVFLLGVFSITLLIWSGQINKSQGDNFARANALMDMQIHIATSHLWLEEALVGDSSVDMASVWTNVDNGIRLAKAILEGGDTEHSFMVMPLKNPESREESEKIITLLTQFKKIALERYSDPQVAGIGSALDTRFDDVFDEFIRRARTLEGRIETTQATDRAKWNRLFFSMILLWASVLAVAVVGLCSREMRRARAEKALLIANDRLQSQTEELKRHRLNLMAMVEERTSELTATNQKLQQEIVEHKQTFDQLDKSKNRFQKLSMEFHALLDAIPDSLTLLSPELKVLWANRCATSGKAVSELTDRHCFELREHRVKPCDDCPALKTFKSGKTESRQSSRNDGSVWDIRAFPLRDDHGQVVSVIEIATDVTEKINLQAESSRMAHLASLGELAAGVAHEINNPINTVINCAQIMEDAGHLESDTRDDLLGRIIKEGDRVASIVSSLLSFANQNYNEKISVPVQRILSEALALSVRQLEKDGIIIETRLPVDLPEIIASPQQIEQVFLNIINNARHALNQKYPGPNKDKVLEISGDIISIENCPCVRVAFHDRGVGIPSSIIGKVLDPFFSTKPKGQGTGLGLSISHGIVKDHGGRLVITSHANEYTKVQVSLPARVRG